MTIYSAFGHTSEPVSTVPEKFSWAAFLLPPVFALFHGLWLMLAGTILAIAVIIAASLFIGGGAGFWLYVLFALWCGFAAPDFRRSALLRSGWRETLPVIAPDTESAELELLRRP